MALLSMVVFSTEENGKDEYLEKSLESLIDTVDFSKHRLFISINGYTNKTHGIIKKIVPHATVLLNLGNIGTAEAINKAWYHRYPGENCIKIDDDIVVHDRGWVYKLEEIVQKDPSIGQVGLKRRDCMESVINPNEFYKSKLIQLDHKPGERWYTVEQVNHVMGSCVLHSSLLLDKIGYMWQPGLYGFDDSFTSLRSHLAGFKNVFLPNIDIEHIDRGDTAFQKWKEQKAHEKWEAYKIAHHGFSTGKKSIYYNPFINDK